MLELTTFSRIRLLAFAASNRDGADGVAKDID